MNRCNQCGGEMIGDGYTLVMHCEYADEEDYWYHECDAAPVECNYEARTAKYNYEEDVYILDGKEINNTEYTLKGWDCACPECKSPASLQSVDHLGEHHLCLNKECKNKFVIS